MADVSEQIIQLKDSLERKLLGLIAKQLRAGELTLE
jgi:hypothetical protein